jgi:threonine dehydrogenase-like Zn-dependent dehydrogenase
LTAGTDPTVVAGRALLRIARDAAAAVEGGRGAAEVVGRGLVAARVRQLVGDRGRLSDQAPAAVVDTTGDPVVIRSALDRVANLGTIVLAGESAGRELDVDLYSSVHRRGLVVVGVASPLVDFDEAGADPDEEDLAAWREELVEVPSGTTVSRDALWYRFEA